MLPELHVVAGVIAAEDGRVLISQRTRGELAGAWEFPGGKVNAGETALEALRRELAEELGIDLVAAEPFCDYRHAYPGRIVRLDVWRVLRYSGRPEGLEGQPLRWEAPSGLMAAGLLEADRPIADQLLGPRDGTVSRPSG